MRNKIARKIIAWAERRIPDLVVGDRYLKRWIVLRSRWVNIYVHRFNGPDYGRELHDHPWWNVTWVLKGGYEETQELEWCVLGGIPASSTKTYVRRTGDIVPRGAEKMHRICRLLRTPTWTLFVTGPRRRRWGFRAGQTGWMSAKDYFEAKGVAYAEDKL